MTRMLLALAAASTVTLTLSAHHSFSAYYFEEQSVTLEGVVQEFQYRSPHAMLMFTGSDAQGQTRTYAAEWGNPNRLSRQGIRRPADGWAWRNRR